MIRSRALAYLWFLTILCVGLSRASAFDVFGSVHDAGNLPLADIRVSIFDAENSNPRLIASVYTDASGFFIASLNATEFLGAQPDISIEVEWSFRIGRQDLFSPGHIKVLGENSNGSPYCFDAITAFHPVASHVELDHDPNLDLDFGIIQMKHGAPDLGQLITNIAYFLEFYQLQLGPVGWTWSNDVQVVILTNPQATTSFTCGGGINAIFIASGDYRPQVPGDISVIYRELAHWMHLQFNGRLFPVTPDCSLHGPQTEEDLSCAFVEGWASYVAETIDTSRGTSQDNHYSVYRDACKSHWRGDEPHIVFCGPCGSYEGTGFDGGMFESGENVEGAIAGALFEVDSSGGPIVPFRTNYVGLFHGSPMEYSWQLIPKFRQAFGANSTELQALFAALQAHGIVYSRGRFASQPLGAAPLAPPNALPPDNSNWISVDGYTIVRGIASLDIEVLPRNMLGVSNTIPAKDVCVGAARVATRSPGGPRQLPCRSGFVTLMSSPLSASVDVDTRFLELLGNAGSDGDWDLAAIVRNENLYEDNLYLPSWECDPNINGDTEGYLYQIGGLFEADGNPATNLQKEGMIVVDNTAPTITLEFPK